MNIALALKKHMDNEYTAHLFILASSLIRHTILREHRCISQFIIPEITSICPSWDISQS